MDSDRPIVLVGNKADLVRKRKVKKEGKRYVHVPMRYTAIVMALKQFSDIFLNFTHNILLRLLKSDKI